MAEHSIYCQVQRLGPCTCGATPKGAAVSAAPPSVAASNTERVVFKCDNPGGCRFPKQPCLASCSLTVNLAPAAGVGGTPEPEPVAWLVYQPPGSEYDYKVYANEHEAESDAASQDESEAVPRPLFFAHGVMVVGTAATHPPCTVCGKPYAEHGTYPTCATHHYTADSRCGASGTLEHGKFVGHQCPGAACRNGCVRGGNAAGVGGPLAPLADGYDGSAVRPGPNHSTVEVWYDTEAQARAAHKALVGLIDAVPAAGVNPSHGSQPKGGA